MDYAKYDTIQYATAPDKSPTLVPKEIRYIQLVVGTFLYYAQSLDRKILLALNNISSQQDTPTTNTMKKSKMLLDYTAAYPDMYLRYYESDTTLHVESDPS